MNPCCLCQTISLTFKCLSVVPSINFSIIFPGTEVSSSLGFPSPPLVNWNDTDYPPVSRDLTKLPRPLADDWDGSCHNICQLIQDSGMNPIRPHGLVKVQLVQLVPYNFSVHKWKVIVPTLTVPLLRGLGSPGSISIIKRLRQKKHWLPPLFLHPR